MDLYFFLLPALSIQVLLVTGGFGKRSSNSVGYYDETEIYQDGQWRDVGKLPMMRKDVKCGTLNNTVFLTGIIDFCFICIQFKFTMLKVVTTPPSFPEQTSSPTIQTMKAGQKPLTWSLAESNMTSPKFHGIITLSFVRHKISDLFLKQVCFESKEIKCAGSFSEKSSVPVFYFRNTPLKNLVTIPYKLLLFLLYIIVDSFELLKSRALSSVTINFFNGPLFTTSSVLSNTSESSKASLTTPERTWLWMCSEFELDEPELSPSDFSLNFLNLRGVTGKEVSFIPLFSDLFLQLPHGFTFNSVQAASLGIASSRVTIACKQFQCKDGITA